MEIPDPEHLEAEPQDARTSEAVSRTPVAAPAEVPAEDPALQALFNLPQGFASLHDLKTFLDEVSHDQIPLPDGMKYNPRKLEAPNGGLIISLNPPKHLNDILVLGKFNRDVSSMGALFVGKRQGQWIVVKTINTSIEFSEDRIAELLQRMEREMKFLELRIPYWIEPLETIRAPACKLQEHTQDGLVTPHMVMPFAMPGLTLDQFCLARQLHDIGRRENFIAAVGLQVCNALEFPHAHDITLRDVTAGNIMITTPTPEKGFVVCLDSALISMKGLTQVTPAHTCMGTPYFMAPEVASCSSYNHLADIYSLGCILYFMATGRYPFLGITPMEMLTKHVFCEIDKSRLDHLTQRLRALILSMLEKQPQNRPQSVYEVATELDEVLGESQLREYMGPAAEFAKRRADFCV